MDIKDFKVGQTVYVELTGNASRGKTIEECIEEWGITSVGRKYITAGKRSEKWGILGEITFEWRDTYKRFVQKTKCCVNYVLYATRQEIEDKHERNRLYDEISEAFRGYGTSRDLTLEQLRKIKEILKQKEAI